MATAEGALAVGTTTVADVLAAQVVTEEVPVVFGLLGEANLALALALRRAGRTWLALRREDAVVAAADGFAQGDGGIGVAFVSQGPALANALNPLIGARKNRTPLVLVTGALPADDVTAPQWCDHGLIAEAAGVPLFGVTSPADAEHVVGAAFRRAHRDGPVVLEIPTRLQTAPVPPAAEPLTRPVGDAPGEIATQPDQEIALAYALALLCEASRPVILAGAGARECLPLLVEIAERTGAALATTLKVKGAFDGHPQDLGVAGGFGPLAGQRVLDCADLALVVGASLNAFTTRGGRLFQNTPLIRVDRLPAPPEGPAAAVSLVGEARPLLSALCDRFRAVDLVARSGWPPAFPDEPEPDLSSAQGLDLRTVARFLDQTLPADRAFCTDLGYFTSEPEIHVRVRHPRRHAFPLHFGSIGLGLATALGLAAADRSVPTLCTVGDGGLMASVGELESLARTGLPVVVAVFNDSAYGVEVHELRHQGEDVDLARFAPVDFAAVAESFGIPALRATHTDDLPGIAAHLRAPTGPMFIDFTLDPDIVTAWYREFVHPAETEELE